jgi:thiamine-phosphate pyrophosphorylase
MTKQPPEPSLCLLAETRQGVEWLDRVGEALDATGAVTLLLCPPQDGALDPATARPLVELAQGKKIAALLLDNAAAVRATGADGVHLSWRPEIDEAYEAMRKTLGPDSIVGADAGFSRHDAMSLGEAGADYVSFGKPPGADDAADIADERAELVQWWSDIFVVPGVAFDVTSTEEVAGLARVGAEFIAVRMPDDVASGKSPIRTWAAELRAALKAPANAA